MQIIIYSSADPFLRPFWTISLIGYCDPAGRKKQQVDREKVLKKYLADCC